MDGPEAAVWSEPLPYQNQPGGAWGPLGHTSIAKGLCARDQNQSLMHTKSVSWYLSISLAPEVCLSWTHCKVVTPRFLTKVFLFVKQRLKASPFKWAEKRSTHIKFYKANGIRKRNQEETCFKVRLGGDWSYFNQTKHLCFDVFPSSKQRNFLFVGTANGNLAIFEDKMVKVSAYSNLYQNLFYMYSLLSLLCD